MASYHTRRDFLTAVSQGTLLVSLGTAACELGLVESAFAAAESERLSFGELEPLVNALQQTHLTQLQPYLKKCLADGLSLNQLVGAAALANARTFGGEDYVGFHTFMALAPALNLARFMPARGEALPVFKVLYRNSERIQGVGGVEAEVLHALEVPQAAAETRQVALTDAIRGRDVKLAEKLLAGLVAEGSQAGLDGLIPAVMDRCEVHRTVLPFKAWEMLDIVGTNHAQTLLRQSVRYCVRANQPGDEQTATEQAQLISKLFDEFQLENRSVGKRPMEDSTFAQLAQDLEKLAPEDAARAVVDHLVSGYALRDIGEAISWAASRLVLRDAGRLPQWEDKLKLAGSVHGDSVGVHASDAAHAWRHLAQASSGRNQFACAILSAWQVARDRQQSPHLLPAELPHAAQTEPLKAVQSEALLALLEESIQARLQARSVAIVQRCAELQFSAEPLFRLLAQFAVSQDGALHAEKYFQTTWDDFHLTRPSHRWSHLMALARVTASEYGTPAAGQVEARELLGV